MLSTTVENTKKFFLEASKNTKIDADRKELLQQIAASIVTEYKTTQEVNLNFICTHNSRRSQLGQVWSFYAAHYFNVPTIKAFSGGTEVTAFHRNTVKTLQKVGFDFHLTEFSHQNPKYEINFEGSSKTIVGFSKVFDDTHNKQPFIAITTCNHADENCPFIPSAIHRFHLPFVDPKASDETTAQEATYLKTNAEIAAQIFFIFSEVKKLIA